MLEIGKRKNLKGGRRAEVFAIAQAQKEWYKRRTITIEFSFILQQEKHQLIAHGKNQNK